MKAEAKTKSQLVDELTLLRRRVEELEEAEAEHKQAEKELRESEANFKALFQNINSGVAVYEAVEDGKDFVFKDLNWTGEHIDRVKRDAIIDKKVTEAFPGVKDFGLLDVLQRVWRTGDPESLPVSFYEDERISGWRDNYIYRLPSRDVVAVYDDITVSKQTEETLRENEKRFEVFFENVNDVIIYIDELGLIIDVNSRIEDIFGYTREELIGKNFTEFGFVEPDTLQDLTNLFVKVLNGESVPLHTLKASRKNGNTNSVELNPRLVHLDNGEKGILVIARNVTEREQAAQKLKEREEIYRITAEKTGQMVYDYNPATGEVKWEGAVETITGYTKEEFQSVDVHGWANLIHPDNREDALRTLDEAQRKCSLYDVEYRFLQKDGNYTYIEEHGVFLPDAQGIAYRMLGSINDITERKQAVAALRESEENYTAVVEQANDGVVVIQDGLYVYVNEAWAQTTGYSRDELMAMTIEDIVIPEHKTIVRERYELRMKGGTPPPLYDIRIQMKNGTIRDIEVSASIIRYHGQPADMAVVRDITERRQAEDALRESEEKFSKAFHSKAYLMALSSIDDGTYIDVNDGFVEVTGYTREEVIGRTSTSLNIFDDPEMRSIIIQSIKESGHARDLEITIRIKNGDLRHGLFAAELVSIKGTPCLLTTMSDVTERKQVDEKLRESERRYRTLVDNNPYGVQETDTSGMIVFANKAHDSIFGYDDGESIGKTIFDPLASDWERKRTWDYWVKLLEEQPLPETYYELGRTKDGQEIDLEVAWNYIRDEQGDIKGFISVLTDITDRKQVEKILKENEQKYRELVEGLDEAVYRMSLPDGKYDYFGPAAKNVFGWNAENFLGKPSFIAEIIHPDFHGYFQEKWADLIKGIIAPTYEFKIIDPENKERWIIQSNKGVFDNSGNIIAIEGLCRDITERKQAEEALRIEKDNLSNIFEAMEDGVYIVNQQNDIQYVNPVLKREYGIYEGRKCYEYFNDLKEACPWCKNHEVFAGKTVRWEWYSFKNQKTYDLIDTPLKNIDGSISKLEIFRDITERKQAEEQLEISERNYREIFDSSNDAIAVHDAIDGTILDVNQKLTEMFGYTYDETLNLTTGDLSQGEPPYSQKEAAEWIRKVIDEGPQLFEWLCKNKNGELFWSEVSLTHVSIGGKDRVLAVDRDITERKQAEESLRESESNLLQAQAIAHLGSFRLDLNTNIIHASEEMLKTYGWAPELSGKLTVEAWQLSVHPDDLDMVSAALENTATVGAPYDIEFRIYRTDGEMRIVHAQGELVRNPSGIPVSIVGTGLDITERKQAEEKIRRFNEELEQRVIERTYQLEAANKELEAFTYSVSHDLRAPLRHVSSFAEILQEEYSGSLPEDAHEHVTTIIESALKMNVLIDGLLGLSRMGRQELNIKSIKLKDIVEEVRKDLEPEVQGRKVKWKIGKLPTIEGDPVLMKAVIVNLLSNAVKFTRHSNPAIIEVSPLPDGKPGFLVSDNGTGFDMQYINKLFGVFQRLHRQADYEGTGIGLATVQRIVTRHNGRVWAEAEINKGATFYVEIGTANPREGE